MKPRRVLAVIALYLPLLADQTFQFSSRGRTYEVLTRRIGSILTFPGHWMYQPSVVTRSALTGGNYLLLFGANLVSGGDIKSGEAIFLSKSPDGHSNFTPPTPVLTNTNVVDLCDFDDARPVWDGSAWHVYVYAVRGNYRSNKCDPTAGIFEATGPSLDKLAWVTYPGTNQARPVVAGQGGSGISEDMQWFVTPSAGPWNFTRFLVTYLDWGAPSQDIFLDISNGSSDPWNLHRIPTAADSGFYILPDAILGQSLNSETLGDPAIGFQSGCVAGDGRYQYPRGIAMYEDLDRSAGRGAPLEPGAFYPGPLESVSSDQYGPRMFRPRLARDEHGYILPVPDVPGQPRMWQSFIYYNDAQIGNQNQCGYFRWFDSNQRFSVSYIEIHEQPGDLGPIPIGSPVRAR